MLLSVTQLQLQRLVFSHCQKTVVTLSICRARGCLRTPQPSFCLKEDYPDYTKILTGIGLKVKVEILLLSPPIFANVPLRDVSENSQSSTQAPPRCTGSAHRGLQPQGYLLRTSPHRTRPSLPELWVQMKPLLFTHTQLRSGTGRHTIHDPRALGLTNGKTNQEPRTPLQKLAAKLPANLEE